MISQVILELSGITEMQEKYMVSLNKSYCWRTAEGKFPEGWGVRRRLDHNEGKSCQQTHVHSESRGVGRSQVLRLIP